MTSPRIASAGTITVFSISNRFICTTFFLQKSNRVRLIHRAVLLYQCPPKFRQSYIYTILILLHIIQKKRKLCKFPLFTIHDFVYPVRIRKIQPSLLRVLTRRPSSGYIFPFIRNHRTVHISSVFGCYNIREMKQEKRFSPCRSQTKNASFHFIQ